MNGKSDLHEGDCLLVMPTLKAESIDSIVTDPPYGLGFMGKDWDHGVPGLHFWAEALRVAKPGAHLLAFGGTRTFHRLAVAIEDAGWQLRDTIMWVYGSGFPKSLNVAKAIDRHLHAEPIVLGPKGRSGAARRSMEGDFAGGEYMATAARTEEAKQWEGWGTGLKPAWEPIILARKPLAGTVAENVMAWGTGAMNIGASLVGDEVVQSNRYQPGSDMTSFRQSQAGNEYVSNLHQGRWPANLVHDGSEDVLAGFPVTATGGGDKSRKAPTSSVFNPYQPPPPEQWEPDFGSAARFFYCAKASPEDRDEGLETLPVFEAAARVERKEGSAGMDSPRAGAGRTAEGRNHHPTVKPTSLMRYLVRLVTPPGGTVLDPFMGSGSTGKAAMVEGFDFIGIDKDPRYVELARHRILAVTLPLFAL